MSDRPPINSESLKARFPEVYREFFSKCAVVCSALRAVAWSGDHLARHEGLSMRVPIPVRTYVGITPKNASEITIVSHVTFDPFLQKFRENKFEDQEQNKLENSLLPFLKKFISLDSKQGFEVYILSELPLEHALGAVGSYLVPLFVSIFMHTKVLTRQHLSSWQQSPLGELIKNKETKFDFVFRLLWKWEMLMYYPTAVGISSLVALVSATVPVLFAAKKSVAHETLTTSILRGTVVDVDTIVDQSHYWAARTTEIFGVHNGWPFPFDWGILQTTETWPIYDTVFTVSELHEHLYTIVEEVRKIGNALLDNVNMEHAPYFYQLCLPERRNLVWQTYLGTSTLLSFQLLLQCKAILERGFMKSNITALFELMNQTHLIYSALHLCSVRMEELVRRFKLEVTARIKKQEVGVKMISPTSRKGCILFTVFPSSIQPLMTEILAVFERDAQEKVSLHYASWLDGYEEEGGVKIEQWLKEGIHSPLLEGGSLRLTRWGKKGETSTTIIQPTDIKKEAFDILFDSVHEKLYVKGKECTSDDLPSQKTAVEILSLLMTTEGHRLHNKMLPQSSYASYRNELQGKIVGPLTALVEKRLKRELQLKIDGTLTDFWVSLDPKGFSIGLIKKLQ